MEKTLKVYIYREGERPVFHQPPIKGIYASEGWFMKLMEANKKFVTKKARKAHLFYLPFSSRVLEETLYVPNSHKRDNLVQCLKDYLDMIGAKYPFWNRTGGADHFLVACHDWVSKFEHSYYQGGFGYACKIYPLNLSFSDWLCSLSCIFLLVVITLLCEQNGIICMYEASIQPLKLELYIMIPFEDPNKHFFPRLHLKPGNLWLTPSELSAIPISEKASN